MLLITGYIGLGKHSKLIAIVIFIWGGWMCWEHYWEGRLKCSWRTLSGRNCLQAQENVFSCFIFYGQSALYWSCLSLVSTTRIDFQGSAHHLLLYWEQTFLLLSFSPYLSPSISSYPSFLFCACPPLKLYLALLPFLNDHKIKNLILFSPLSSYVTLDRRQRFAQSCLTLCDPTDCSLPGSSVHGVLQARVLEWVVIPFSRGSSRPRDQTWFSHI